MIEYSYYLHTSLCSLINDATRLPESIHLFPYIRSRHVTPETLLPQHLNEIQYSGTCIMDTLGPIKCPDHDFPR